MANAVCPKHLAGVAEAVTLPATMAPAAAEISVVMTTYNSHAYLQETLLSIQKQSFTNFEFVVADDGSSDDRTLALLNDIARHDHRVRLITHEHCGIPAILRNLAFRACIGEFIVWLDDDDPMLPTRLAETLRAFLLAPPSVGLVFSDYHVIDCAGLMLHASGLVRYSHLRNARYERLADGVNLLRRHTAFNTLLIGNYLRPSIVAIRRSCLAEIGPLDESLQNGDDLDLFLRIARRWDFVWVERALAYYRERPGSISSRGPLKLAPDRIRVLQKRFQEGLEPRQRRIAHRMIAQNLFDIGYAERKAGHYTAAIRVLGRSLGYAVSWSALKELVLSIALSAFD
jgi:glycosyltransferase involved in cell wall biosynthesis